MLGEIYGNPRLLDNIHLPPGAIVKHIHLPGVDLAVVSGPEDGAAGAVYRVLWRGEVVPVLRSNLIIWEGS